MNSILEKIFNIQNMLNQMQKELDALQAELKQQKPTRSHKEANKKHLTDLLKSLSFMASADCPVKGRIVKKIEKYAQAINI